MSRVECEVCGFEAFVGEDPQTKVFRQTLCYVDELLDHSGLHDHEVVRIVEGAIGKALRAYPDPVEVA